MKFLNTEEAANLLKVTKATIYKWVHEKFIPHRKHGGKVIFTEQELMDWSSQNSIVTNDEVANARKAKK
ncbi:MAG: hypothetical protein A4S09_14190 [Proteobacteria bacterium SG_bin7]|nr:MAG: hypothetical protein A4S09_14190 [Proteobacteria bacterium SG_bin7]